MSFKSGFESREKERERESQFNTAGGSEFQVRGTILIPLIDGVDVQSIA